MEDEYIQKLAESVGKSQRAQLFSHVRSILEAEGISVLPGEKVSNIFNDETTATLVHGAIEPLNNIAITGVCLPENMRLQTLLPLLLTKELFAKGKIEKAYIPLPVATYGAVGLPRFKEYAQLLTYIGNLFGKDEIGSRVIPMPDYALLEERALVSTLCAPEIGEAPSREKYPFGNLFGAVETAGYGADVALPVVAEKSPVTVMSDFKQFESIHAGKKSAKKLGKSMGFDVGALMLTTLIAETENNLLHEKETKNSDINSEEIFPELNIGFLAAAFFEPFHATVGAYDRTVKEGKIQQDFIEKGASLLRGSSGPLADFKRCERATQHTIEYIEEMARDHFAPAKRKLQILLNRRMRNSLVSSSQIMGDEL